MNPRWALELLGSNEVLADARALFKNTDPSTALETLGCGRTATLLFSRQFEAHNNRRAVYALAKCFVDRVNGVLFVGNERRAPIAIAGGPMERAKNGRWNYSLIAEPGTFVIASVNSPGGSLIGENVVGWMQAACSDELVGQVLTYLSNNPDWVDLYKVWECVAADIKERNKMAKVAFELPHQKEIKAFKAGANKQHRHRPTAQHPLAPKMMSPDEGTNFIRELVRDWLRWRSLA